MQIKYPQSQIVFFDGGSSNVTKDQANIICRIFYRHRISYLKSADVEHSTSKVQKFFERTRRLISVMLHCSVDKPSIILYLLFHIICVSLFTVPHNMCSTIYCSTYDPQSTILYHRMVFLCEVSQSQTGRCTYVLLLVTYT